MKLNLLSAPMTVCRLRAGAMPDLTGIPFCFFARTDEELSLVCPTEFVPPDVEAREDGWRGFRIEGILDFSLVGVLSRLSGILAEKGIGIFAVSTYNTDYILVREKALDQAVRALLENGYTLDERTPTGI